jgi:hypothetical protein
MMQFYPEEPMKKPTLKSLEKRVAVLEEGLAQLLPSTSSGIVWKDWRQAVGKYRATEISEEVDAAGREIREADRREAQS